MTDDTIETFFWREVVAYFQTVGQMNPATYATAYRCAGRHVARKQPDAAHATCAIYQLRPIENKDLVFGGAAPAGSILKGNLERAELILEGARLELAEMDKDRDAYQIFWGLIRDYLRTQPALPLRKEEREPAWQRQLWFAAHHATTLTRDNARTVCEHYRRTSQAPHAQTVYSYGRGAVLADDEVRQIVEGIETTLTTFLP